MPHSIRFKIPGLGVFDVRIGDDVASKIKADPDRFGKLLGCLLGEELGRSIDNRAAHGSFLGPEVRVPAEPGDSLGTGPARRLPLATRRGV